MNSPQASDLEEEKIESDLQRLRSLLLGAEYEEVLALKDTLHDPAGRARFVAEIIAEAVARRSDEGHELADALEPSVEEAIHRSVREDPYPLADALFPVIGPAVRRSVREAISGMVRTLDQLLQHAFSPASLKLRLQAWATRRPFAELLLLRTLVYRVEQVFLIHRETGILLRHIARPDSTYQDPDMVAGMLTAVQDVIQDAFGADEAGPAATVMGDYSVYTAFGQHAIVAAVVRGQPPEPFTDDLNRAVEQVHWLMSDELRGFQGDNSRFERVDTILEPCLQEKLRTDASQSRPWLALILIALIVSLLGWWAWGRYQDTRGFLQTVSALEQVPGLIVIKSGRQSGGYFVRGLKDPSASPDQALSQIQWAGVDRIEWQWQPFLSLNDQMVLARALRAWPPLPTVQLALSGSTLWIEGEASVAWARAAPARYGQVAGIGAIDVSQLTVLPAPEALFQELKSEIEAIRILFDAGESALPEDPSPIVSPLLERLGRLNDLAGMLEQRLVIQVRGFSDSVGSEAFNRRLSLERAQSVATALRASGLGEAIRTEVVGMGVSPAEPDGNSSQQRRVELKIDLGP